MSRARVALAVLAATCALAAPSAALGSPTIPHVHPVAERVTVWPDVPFSVVWEPSTFDSDAYWTYYEAAVSRYPTGAPSASFTTTEKVGCCSYTFPIVAGYHYVVRVRGTQFYWCGLYGPCRFSWSPWWVVSFDAVSLPSAGF